MHAKVEFDLELQKIEYQGRFKFLDLTSLIDEFEFKEGSRTKLVKALDLTFLIKIFLCLQAYITVHWELRSSEQPLRGDGKR